MRFALPSLAFLSFVSIAAPLCAQEAKPRQRPQRPPQTRPELPLVDEFSMRSPCLSEFWGRDMSLVAGVVRPLDWKDGEKLPVCYNVHGFGGSHEAAWFQGPSLQKAEQSGAMPRMLYVFLNAQCERGHHEFADSVNNGPCGRALTTEFIPALEKKFGGVGEPWARFVTGHSSGGWSSLWLEVTYPDVFGGCWSTAPDSVDFRDFTGIDVYSYENAYQDPEGNPIMLVRQNGKFVSSIKQYVDSSDEANAIGGQFYSFNAVFSPRANDGTPMKLFDWKTGAINSDVADSWRKYDISLILQENWKTLGPKLKGKVHVWIGTIDTFRLEGATTLLKEELAKLGSDADILLVEGRDHGSLFAPQPELWPKGMMTRIHNEMWASYQKSVGAHAH
jgi:S-formylglutathione hydrolase FrmB